MGFVTFDFKFVNAKLKNGDPVEGCQKRTPVWLKKDDKWKLIHEHLTTKK